MAEKAPAAHGPREACLARAPGHIAGPGPPPGGATRRCMDEDTAPLILTLGLDPETQAWLESMRRAHFPPARNLVPAHVTLFHALPGEHAAEIQGVLAAEAAALPP